MHITINKTITVADLHRHIPHEFEVPEGTTEIHIEFSYAPEYATNQVHRNQMSLSLFDPEGARGVYYLIRDWGITLNAAKNTPGFNNGPLQPGTWTVYVDTYRLLPPDPITYQIDITLSSHPLEATAPHYPPKKSLQRGRGWYRGDLHAHTLHSDASWDVIDLVNYARQEKLDFITLTDHNTISGLPEHDSLTDDNLLTMGGLELTTYYGHALALGKRQWYEWRLDIDERPTMPELAQRVMDSGAFFVIAHPMSPGDPICSGCRWEYDDMRPGNARAVEVWNGGWREYNELSLQECYKWLNNGHRLALTAGSDMHGPPSADDGRVGRNVAYAEELSEVEILKAIRQGHSYLSAGPELVLTAATQDGLEAMAGDKLPATGATLSVRWSGAHAGDVLRLVADGNVVDVQPAAVSGEKSWSIAPEQAHWCTVELRDASGGMWAISNPIFFGDEL
jgi:hypothetical protein